MWLCVAIGYYRQFGESSVFFVCAYVQKLPDVVEDVGVSNSELEAESHQAEALVRENTTLQSQLEEMHQRLSQREEVDTASSTRQQLEQVKCA